MGNCSKGLIIFDLETRFNAVEILLSFRFSKAELIYVKCCLYN